MVESLSVANLKNFAISFSPFESHIRRFPYDPSMKLGYESDLQELALVEVVIKRVKKDPKYHIWIGAYSVLVSIVDMYGYSDYKQWAKAKKLFTDDSEQDGESGEQNKEAL